MNVSSGSRVNFGRFEWLCPPTPNPAPARPAEGAVPAFAAGSCPHCGWVDAPGAGGRVPGVDPKAGCWRCGRPWSLEKEHDRLCRATGVRLPAPRVRSQPFDWRRCYRVGVEAAADFDACLAAQRADLQTGFDRLRCLDAVDVSRFDHQIETALKVLDRMGGRALLADEVGMGKTVEAGLVVKELMDRRMARRVLVVVPAGLVRQWQQELADKFALALAAPVGAREDGRDAERIVISYERARRRDWLLDRSWDVVVLDEAHRLKNRRTGLYRFVRRISARYLLALTATPVQNRLDELYALVDLVQPGVLGTVRTFHRTYVSRRDPRRIAGGRRRALREVLAGVMIRNRRDACGIDFPRRRAAIYHVRAGGREMELYRKVSEVAKKTFQQEVPASAGSRARMLPLMVLQRGLLSSPQVVRTTLGRLAAGRQYPPEVRRRLDEMAAAAGRIQRPAKAAALTEILDLFPRERFIVFTEFVATMEALAQRIGRRRTDVVTFCGRHSAARRVGALDRFRSRPGAVLVATDAAGTGLNLQHCRCLVNYDLPWNPMRIEQRIGRCDRIGQGREVRVFNLAVVDTLEERLLEVLARKIRMFELVVGELRNVLGQLGGEGTFERNVARIWLESETSEDERRGFERFGRDLARARRRHDRQAARAAALA